MTLRVLFAGASGLVGAQAVRRLLARADIEVHAPVRRALASRHAQLHEYPLGDADAAALAGLASAWSRSGTAFDVYACALGTTLRKAGSQAAFVAVDRDLVRGLAGIARDLRARQAIVVSSVGADPRSANFYLRVKGEMESAIRTLGFERVDILRPGLLLGSREESRSGEHLAQRLAPLYNPFLRGPLRRYAAIDAGRVAAAMASLVGVAGPGLHRWENAAIEARAD